MIKVDYARLAGGADDVFVPGLGTLGKTLPSPSKSVPMEMYLGEGPESGLLVICIGNRKAAVPVTSFQVLVYSAENTKASKPTKVA